MEQAKEIRYGCRFGGDGLVVVQVSRSWRGMFGWPGESWGPWTGRTRSGAYNGEPLVLSSDVREAGGPVPGRRGWGF